MFQRTILEITTPSGVPVEHGLITHDQPKGLVVILPGWGYLCDAPGLYYPRKAAVDLGYDVLSVTYGFQVARDRSEVVMQTLNAEVDHVLATAVERSYPRMILIGKSLGTPLAATLAHKHSAERLILLTPIGTAVQDAGSLPTLAVIGTADERYNAAQIAADRTRANVRWLVLEGMNHSMEIAGDWSASLDGLRRITQACEDFLR